MLNKSDYSLIPSMVPISAQDEYVNIYPVSQLQQLSGWSESKIN
jgi:hypothetical protein